MIKLGVMLFAATVFCAGVGHAQTRTKGYLGVEDLKVYDGVTDTFNRTTSTGGTNTYHKIDQADIPYKSLYPLTPEDFIDGGYDVTLKPGDIIEAKPRVSIRRHSENLHTALTAFGSTLTECVIDTIVPVTQSETVLATTHFNFIHPGKFIINNGVTLTISQARSIGNPDYQVFQYSGTGNVSISGGGEMNPIWWGAVGDGVTNDTASVQAALDQPVRAAYFPPGYTFMVTTLSAYSNSRLRIAGTIKSMNGNADMITNSGSISNVKIWGGGIIDGNKAAGSGTSRGIYFSHASGISDVGIFGMTIKNCYTDAITIHDGTDVRIHDNRIYQPGQKAINCQGYAKAAARYEIVDNTIIAPTSSNGIYISGAASYALSDFIVEGNTIFSAGADGISVGNYSSDIQIKGNRLKYCAGNGISLTSVTGAKLQGNYCSNNNTNGILITDSAHAEVLGNACFNNYQTAGADTTASGIKITQSSGTLKYVSVKENRCYDTQASPTQPNGVYYGTTTSCQITGNFLYSNKTNGIFSGGANTNTWACYNQKSNVKPITWFTYPQGSKSVTAQTCSNITSNTQTVTGAALGDQVTVTADQLIGSFLVSAHVTAADTVRVVLFNANASGTHVLPAMNITVILTKKEYLQP